MLAIGDIREPDRDARAPRLPASTLAVSVYWLAAAAFAAARLRPSPGGAPLMTLSSSKRASASRSLARNQSAAACVALHRRSPGTPRRTPPEMRSTCAAVPARRTTARRARGRPLAGSAFEVEPEIETRIAGGAEQHKAIPAAARRQLTTAARAAEAMRRGRQRCRRWQGQTPRSPRCAETPARSCRAADRSAPASRLPPLRVIARERAAQPRRLHAHDRIGLRIEIVRAAERLDRDGVALDTIGLRRAASPRRRSAGTRRAAASRGTLRSQPYVPARARISSARGRFVSPLCAYGHCPADFPARLESRDLLDRESSACVAAHSMRAISSAAIR